MVIWSFQSGRHCLEGTFYQFEITGLCQSVVDGSLWLWCLRSSLLSESDYSVSNIYLPKIRGLFLCSLDGEWWSWAHLVRDMERGQCITRLVQLPSIRHRRGGLHWWKLSWSDSWWWWYYFKHILAFSVMSAVQEFSSVFFRNISRF